MNKIQQFCIRKYIKRKFSKIGNDVYIGAGGIFHFKNIEIGNDVYIGPNACFQSSFGKIKIGSHVMFGPGVNIHGGNHIINEVGKLMKHTSKKSMGDDGVIVIEDDCWIGANAIILSNVTIGQGSVIGAGSIVTKDVPPYSIYTGAPNKKLRPRFSEEELSIHKNKIHGGMIYDILCWLLFQSREFGQKTCISFCS